MSKLPKIRGSKEKIESNGVILETFASHDENGNLEESMAGMMINSNMLNKHGYETKASLSRVDQDSWSGYQKSESSQYFHIQNAANPFNIDNCGVSANESIDLCQKAFYSFPSFRNPILMQSYLSNSPLHFVGKDKKVVSFFKEWAKKCNLWNLTNEFFLEWFRSGNVFVYSFEGEIKLSTAKEMQLNESIAKNRSIPLKYIILNPADIRGLGSTIFSDQTYGKVLNAYEVEKLRNPKTEEDQLVYDSLDEKAKKSISMRQTPIIALDGSRLRLAFNAKQSYEPMSVPPYFGVLKSINFKQILRSAEEKVAASADYCILLVTAGEKDKKASENKRLIEGIGNLFSAQSVGRVLFTDYTAKAQFIIPDFNLIFGGAKYENVDRDIINGMNDIMASDENFATGQTKTKIYLQLLDQARESFLNYFLRPEINKIAKEMGFTEIPDAQFEEITLESLNESKKTYNRLYELGALTPQDLFNAYKTNQLPIYEVSLENQIKNKEMRNKGLFEPLISPSKGEAGRPSGTIAPKTTNTISPQGQASFEKLQENFPKMNDLSQQVIASYKKKNDLSRLSKKNKELCDSIWEKIMASEPMENWDSCVSKYISNPLSFNVLSDQYSDVTDLMANHNIDLVSASILFHSKVNKL